MKAVTVTLIPDLARAQARFPTTTRSRRKHAQSLAAAGRVPSATSAGARDLASQADEKRSAGKRSNLPERDGRRRSS